MTAGEFLTLACVWVSLTAYTVSVVLQLARVQSAAARIAWVAGCAAFAGHVVSAFHFYHDWSHTAAWQETERQTTEVTGFRTGIGLYLNYLFTVVWLADAGWWLAAGDLRYAARRRRVWVSLHVFFLFMIVNGAIVFAAGAGRWYGVALVAMILVAFIRRSRASSSNPDGGS